MGAAASLTDVADDDDDLGPSLIEAAGILISSDSAAHIFTEECVKALRHHDPQPESSLLLELVYAALSIPAVCQASATWLYICIGMNQLLHISVSKRRSRMCS